MILNDYESFYLIVGVDGNFTCYKGSVHDRV